MLINPIFSRTSIPGGVKTALVLITSLLLAPNVAVVSPAVDGVDMIISIARELMIGVTLSYIFAIYYYMLQFSADMMDLQFGLSMAKAMDPQTQIQTGISGNLLTVLFMLYFFATNSHLVLLQIAAYSFVVIPAGGEGILIPNMAGFVMEIFASIFSLALRLSLPYLITGFILEISMGILMKLIPQIHIFVIHMQAKIILGIILLLVLASPLATFIDNYIISAMKHMQDALSAMLTT